MYIPYSKAPVYLLQDFSEATGASVVSPYKQRYENKVIADNHINDSSWRTTFCSSPHEMIHRHI